MCLLSIYDIALGGGPRRIESGCPIDSGFSRVRSTSTEWSIDLGSDLFWFTTMSFVLWSKATAGRHGVGSESPTRAHCVADLLAAVLTRRGGRGAHAGASFPFAYCKVISLEKEHSGVLGCTT